MLTWFPQLQKYVIYIQIEEMLLELSAYFALKQ
jgi:hypothetical protein